MSDEFLPEAVRELSTCTRVVYLALEDADHPLTYDDLVERTGVTKRTTRQVIGELADDGVVESRPDPRNTHRKLHALADDEPDDTGTQSGVVAHAAQARESGRRKM